MILIAKKMSTRKERMGNEISARLFYSNVLIMDEGLGEG